eukprot:GFUD01002470.1.p1 GENE.GFUD01002470.1~~GFUD01002470.1.p1  ORF type:complete len:438 (-),score=107.45 GFUD01002470.1:141-1454(-)
MELEAGSGVRHRKLKVDAYRSAHRLLRIANRKARGKDRERLVGVALLAPYEPEDEDENKKKEERSERIEKNKEWRKRREMQKWESCGLDPPPDPSIEKEKNRKIARKFEKQLCSELTCSNCRCELVVEVWECLDGHPTCGDCFDRENMGKDVEIQRSSSISSESSDLVGLLQNINSNEKSRKSSSTKSTASMDSLKTSLSTSSIATLSSIESIASLRESLADIAEGNEDAKSWAKYKVNEIDFFLDTLEVRKDAINFYNDYNNAFKSIFYNPDLEGLSLNGDSNEGILNNEYKDEKTERVLKYIERLREQGCLAALRETLIDVIETEDEEIDPSWAKFRLEELDFFFNTLDIRKDAITYYGDYHNGFRSIFGIYELEDLDGDGNPVVDETNETNIDGKINNKEGKPRITKCKLCRQFICKRNLQVEKLAKLFFQVEK